MQHYITNTKGQFVGVVEPTTIYKKVIPVYKTRRIFHKGQVFVAPQYENGIAIETEILERLYKAGIRYVEVYLPDYYEEPVFLYAEILTFLKEGKDVCFDRRKEGMEYTGYGTQKVLPMKRFVSKDTMDKQTTVVEWVL